MTNVDAHVCHLDLKINVSRLHGHLGHPRLMSSSSGDLDCVTPSDAWTQPLDTSLAFLPFVSSSKTLWLPHMSGMLYLFENLSF